MNDRPTHLWPVHPRQPDPATIAVAGAIVRAGGLVAFPTETVYGLGGNALDARAVADIFAAKGRPPNNPLIVHVACRDDALALVSNWPPMAQRLVERFWPGPLTIVVPRSAAVPDVLTGGGPTVAIRCPAHPVALALLRSAGVPIAAPSANRSSELSPTLAEHVLQGLNGFVDAILDAGPTTAGIESTVVDVSGPRPRLLRPGPISPHELAEALGTTIDRLEPAISADASPLLSPGMLARHYAPRTPLRHLDAWDKLGPTATELASQGKRVGILTTRPLGLNSPRITEYLVPGDPQGFAAQLYQSLHALDDMNLDIVLTVLPPDGDEWLAVRDRLSRAATAE